MYHLSVLHLFYFRSFEFEGSVLECCCYLEVRVSEGGLVLVWFNLTEFKLSMTEMKFNVQSTSP